MRTVLIADRSLTIRRVVEHALAGRAARVVGAGDADELFRYARTESPDVVICDASLPGLTLASLRADLSALEAGERAPLVLLTSALDPLPEESADSLGASARLLKPFDIASLVQTIDRAIERGVVPSRPEVAGSIDDETRPPAAGGTPEPPRFEDDWEEPPVYETDPAADDPYASDEDLEDETPSREPDSARLPEQPDEEPLPVSGGRPPLSPDDEEPLGPLGLRGDETPLSTERVPLPGDDGFRLGISPLAGESLEVGDDDSRGRGERDPLDELEPELRVLVERIVREVAWEVLPDIVERIVRESRAGATPDPSSGDRKP